MSGIEIAPPSLTDEANLEVHVVWGELQVLGRHDGAHDGDAALHEGGSVFEYGPSPGH